MSKRRILSIGLILFLSTISCSAIRGEISPFDTRITDTGKILSSPTAHINPYWVIFTKEQAEEMDISVWLGTSDNYWTPSPEDILNLEDALPEYLQQNSLLFYQEPPVWQRLNEYHRQFVGLERGGLRIIYGNYFCHSGSPDWRQEIVVVLDGGECYFQLEYDVESGEFIKLLVNGEA